MGWGEILRAWAAAEADEEIDVTAEIAHGLADWQARGSTLGLSYFLTLLAEAYSRAGEHDEAANTLEEAERFTAATHERWWYPELHRCRGELVLRERSGGEAMAEAEELFEKALEVARAQGSRSLELRASLSLGRLWRRQGKTAPASQLVESVYHGFDEGLDTSDLRRAQRFLAELATIT